MNVTADNLNDFMTLDRVVTVHNDGTVSDAPGLSAPEIWDGELESSNWEIFTNHTAQQGGGSTMHNCEHIGGRLANDILAEPGTYAAVGCWWHPETLDDDVDMEGWAVVKLIDA